MGELQPFPALGATQCPKCGSFNFAVSLCSEPKSNGSCGANDKETHMGIGEVLHHRCPCGWSFTSKTKEAS